MHLGREDWPVCRNDRKQRGMERVPESFAANGAGDLSKAEPFALGPLSVDPPARRVGAGARSEMLEPRVMRVLVALGETPGKVLSRDDLIELCWDGRIVSDKAITRATSLLRHAIEDLSGGAVRLETIARVGFRIVVEGARRNGADLLRPAPAEPGEAEPAAPAARPRKWTRRAAIAGAVLTGAALGVEYHTRSPHAAHTPSPQAEELMRRGLQEANFGGPGALARAIGLFQQAVAADPQYADAWGALAAAYRDSANPFVRQPQSTRERLTGWAARRALALEPDHPEAQAVLASFYPNFGRWAEQEARLRAMVLRFPDHWRSNHSLARTLFYVGRFEHALPYAHRVIQLNPAFVLGWITLARVEHWAGRDREADIVFADATSRWPGESGLSMARFSTYIGSKRYAEAAEWIRDPDHRPTGMTRAQAEGLAKLPEAILRGHGAEYLAKGRQLMPFGFNPGAMMSIHWIARLGGWDLVFEKMEAYYLGGEVRSSYVEGSRMRLPPPGSFDERDTAIMLHPAVLEKRDDPRFVSIVERIGLEDYWRKSGAPDFRRRPAASGAASAP
jgi:DNA-binding winged helix-turn-helix (wHTH) protein/tetratricopeptide (TPR) repeat protein